MELPKQPETSMGNPRCKEKSKKQAPKFKYEFCPNFQQTSKLCTQRAPPSPPTRELDWRTAVRNQKAWAEALTPSRCRGDRFFFRLSPGKLTCVLDTNNSQKKQKNPRTATIYTQSAWCFWIVMLEKTLISPSDCKEIQPVNSKGNQSWIFIGRTDTEAEAPILWPSDVNSWLTGKILMLRKIEGRTSDDRGWDGWMASLTQ